MASAASALAAPSNANNPMYQMMMAQQYAPVMGQEAANPQALTPAVDPITAQQQQMSAYRPPTTSAPAPINSSGADSQMFNALLQANQARKQQDANTADQYMAAGALV